MDKSPIPPELDKADDFWEEIYDTATEIDEQSLQDLCPSITELKSIEHQYSQETLIAQGTLKEVYKSYDQRVKRYVAIARPKAGLDISLHELFIHEAWLTSYLNHPNIIKVYDISLDDSGTPYFTMDLKGNRTLKDFINEAPNLQLRLEVFLKICDAVSYAHSMHVIHLDLKPENIQCDRFGEVLVCDWGLGKILKDDSDLDIICQNQLYNSENATLYGDIKGSLGYMAPEQSVVGEKKTTQTDIFSLGCLLYFILTNQAPFTGDRRKILTDTAEAQYEEMGKLASYRGRKSINAVVKKALQKQPAERYASVEHLKEDIHKYISGHTTGAEKPSLVRKGTLFIHRHKYKCVIAGVSMLIMLSLANLVHKSLTEKEKSLHLAESLRVEINNIEVEKELFDNATAILNKQLSHEVVKYSNQLFENFMLAEDPKKYFWELETILNSAIQKNPNNKAAYNLMNRVSMIKMDYATTIKNAPFDVLEPDNIRLKLANKFPHYSYGSEKRPTLHEMVLNLKRMKSLPKDEGEQGVFNQLIDHMLFYDWHTRADKKNYDQVIKQAIQSYNLDLNLNITFNTVRENLKISSPNNLLLRRISKTNEGSKSILHYLDLNRCVISCEKHLNIHQLHGSNIKFLDLRDNKRLHISEETHIAGLKEVIISQNQRITPRLKEFLNPNQDYTITKVAE